MSKPMTHIELGDLVDTLTSAGLLREDQPIQLRVGGGNTLKHVEGYVVSDEGLVLLITGNAPTVTKTKTPVSSG